MNGLYPELLKEKETIEKEFAQSGREKIRANFRTQTEIRQKKDALNQIIKEDNIKDESLTQVVDQLNQSYNASSLLAAAKLEVRQNNYEKALEYVNKGIEMEFENPDLWQLKAEIFGYLKMIPEEQEAKQRYTEFVGKKTFKRNLKKQIIITNVTLSNMPFYGSLSWSLKPNINILLGKNGFGKSHLMTIVLAQLQEDVSNLIDLTKIKTSPVEFSDKNESFVRIALRNSSAEVLNNLGNLENRLEDLSKEMAIAIKDLTGTSKEVVAKYNEEIAKINGEMQKAEQSGESYFSRSGSLTSSHGKIPILAIPDSRFINKSVSYASSPSDERAKKIIENGAYHFIEQIPYENAIQNFLNIIGSLCKDGKKFDDAMFDLINNVFVKLTGKKFEWVEATPTEDRSGYYIKVLTEGSNIPLPIQKISQGTLSVLSVVGLIFHYLSLRYPDVPRNQINKQHAVVFIDELDAHLHPSWQQKIIGILRAEFPRIQFVISAHSPLVVAGSLDGEVSVLRQLENGYSLEQFAENFIGRSTAEIFQTVFAVEDRDEQYIKYSNLSSEAIDALEKRKEALITKQEKENLSATDKDALKTILVDLNNIESAKLMLEQRTDKVYNETAYEAQKMELEKLRKELSILRSKGK
jgi:predicted ATP-binding protein involved in virulence